MWRYATLPVLSQISRKLSFNNMGILWNITILWITFVKRVHRNCVWSFLQIGEFAWEEFGKIGLQHFVNLREKKKKGRQKWAWSISRDSAQFREWLDMVFECATKYMGVISQNTLSLIISPPSGGNSQPLRLDYQKFRKVWLIFQVWWVLGYVQVMKNAIIWDKNVVTTKE